jgi:hypothetical protein
VSIVTKYGIVFPDNGYLGGDKYYPVLNHQALHYGDGSIKYEVKVDANTLTNADLDALGYAILENIRKYKARL